MKTYDSYQEFKENFADRIGELRFTIDTLREVELINQLAEMQEKNAEFAHKYLVTTDFPEISLLMECGI